MFKLDLSNGLTEKQITKIIETFAAQIERFGRLKRYYNNNNAILGRAMTGSRPNNKIAHSFCRYIANMASGYFMGKGVRILIEDEGLNDMFNAVVPPDTINDLTFALAKEASVYGVSYELLYLSEQGELKSKKFSADEFIPIYSNNVGEFLEGAIRIWSDVDIFDDNAVTKYAALYTKSEVITYKTEKNKEEYREVAGSRYPHRFGDVPVIIYQNNDEMKGDFEDIISLVDAYDMAQSDTANDFEYFTNAYLCVTGAGGGFAADSDDDGNQMLNNIKNHRILFLDEKGQAEWLIKNVNDTAVENYKNRLYHNIFFLSQVPALTDEKFGSNVSGIAIKYRLIGLEELAAEKESKFKTAMKKKLRFITDYINLRENRAYEASDINIRFNRNDVNNIPEIVDYVVKLEGIVSKETQLGLAPFVFDPLAEIERMEQERRQIEHADDLL